MGTVIYRDEKISWSSREAHHELAYYWFDLDHYHKYDMSWLGNQSDFQRGPQPKQFTEVRWWMQDNLEGEILVVNDDRTSSAGGITVYLYFQHEADMMAFKLRWEE